MSQCRIRYVYVSVYSVFSHQLWRVECQLQTKQLVMKAFMRKHSTRWYSSIFGQSNSAAYFRYSYSTQVNYFIQPSAWVPRLIKTFYMFVKAEGLWARDKLIADTTVWPIFWVRMEETGSRNGGWLQLYWISKQRQSTTVVPPAWGLGRGANTPSP